MQVDWLVLINWDYQCFYASLCVLKWLKSMLFYIEFILLQKVNFLS